jgi:serine/threonine protein kinase
MDHAEIQLFLSETLAGRYRPLNHLGSGNFSGTFRSEDQTDGGEVAAKILKLKHCTVVEAVQEFQDEVRLLQRLAGCDRVVELLNSGQHVVDLCHPLSGGTIPVTTHFAVMELAAGSLADLLLQGPSFGWGDRLRMYRDVVKGVHQMHLKGIVYRDAKAENALVFDRPPTAKVADLGRAHDTAEPPRFAAEAYMAGRGDLRAAPLEFLWLQGTQDPEDQALADLYLLGSLLFEVATGTFLTSMITPDPMGIIRANVARPADDRERDWTTQMGWLRQAAVPAYETFAGEVPGAIRPQAVQLLQLLTDPSPRRRLPRFHGARRAVTPWDLEWLLARVDGLRRGIDPTLRKSYLNQRPNRRPRPRHGAQTR